MKVTYMYRESTFGMPLTVPIWTGPWTFHVGTPWVGPLGPVSHLGGLGTHGPFRPIHGPFLAHFHRALHLD